MGITPTNLNSLTGVGSIDVTGMDIETALMAVQSQRAQLLESQLADQIKEVQNRNDQVASLNAVLSELNKATASLKSDAKAKDTVSSEWASANGANLTTAISNANLASLGLASDPKKITRSELESAINTIKGQVDNLNNTQQMDMLRLQSLTNKRNEAFDVMTNFIKKMQDSRSSIIGNMR